MRKLVSSGQSMSPSWQNAVARGSSTRRTAWPKPKISCLLNKRSSTIFATASSLMFPPSEVTHSSTNDRHSWLAPCLVQPVQPSHQPGFRTCQHHRGSFAAESRQVPPPWSKCNTSNTRIRRERRSADSRSALAHPAYARSSAPGQGLDQRRLGHPSLRIR